MAEKYKHKAVYTGRRLSGKKVMHRLELLPSRKEMYFSGLKRVYIGFTYKCSKDRIATRPERTEDARIDNAEWETADALVDASRAEARAEAKIGASSKPALRAAVALLKPFVKGRDYFETKALISYLVNQARKSK